MADLSSLSQAQLRAEGHQLIEQLLGDKPEHMHYSIAKAHIYYWFNWFVLENVRMQLWYEGYHFSNMNRQQMLQVNQALRNTTLTQILQQVHQQLYASYQNRIIPKTKKTKKGKEPATQVHRITEEEFYYKIIFHDILYGNEEGTTLLDTPESITLQQHIDEYLKTLRTETTSIDLKLTMFTEVGLEAWLKQFFKNTQTLETITTFVRELLTRASMFQIPDETASSLEITATTAPLAATTKSGSQKSAPSPTATTKDKTKPQVQSETHTKTNASVPTAKIRQRQREYKQQKQHIIQAISKCFIDGALQWQEYIKVLAVYKHKQQLLDLCYELLHEQQLAYHEKQYQKSKQQILQPLAQESRAPIAEPLSAPASNPNPTATLSSTAASSSSSAISSAASVNSQIIDEFQLASSYRSSKTKPKHDASGESKKSQKTQHTTCPRAKIPANNRINNKVILAIQENNLLLVQKYYNNYQFTTAFTRFAIFFSFDTNHPNIFEFLITFYPQTINISIALLSLTIEQRYDELLVKLLQHITVESQQENHYLLNLAIYKDNFKAVELLLTKYPAMLNQLLYHNSASPLAVAVYYGHSKIIKLLLEAGADPNLIKNDSISPSLNNEIPPLITVVQNGNIEIVRLFLEHGANPNLAFNTVTPLSIATKNNYTEIVKLLLQYNADVNKAMEDGITTLYIAAQQSNIEIVKLLLKFKANPNQAMNNGLTPLAFALRISTSEKCFLIVKALLEGGAIADQIIDNNITPLLIAVNIGDIDIVTLLLSKSKESLNHANFDGIAPLYLAAKQGHTEIVKLLLAEQDIDINQATIEEITPIVIASQQGHSKIVKLLLEANAIITPKMANTIVAQFFQQVLSNKISSAEFAEILPLLLKKGAEIDHTNEHGNTYLMIATAFKKIELVTILLTHQADPTKAQITKDGVTTQKTAISIAEHQGNQAILALLQTATRGVTAISRQTPPPSFTPALTSQGARTLAATSSQACPQASALNPETSSATTATASAPEAATPTTANPQASSSQAKITTGKKPPSP